MLIWRLPRPRLAIASGPLGGGLGLRYWVLNATVPMSYRRDDPAVHLAELADGLGLRGPGAGLLTGVDVTEVVTMADEGVTAWATVGLGLPTWAAEPATRLPRPGRSLDVGERVAGGAAEGEAAANSAASIGTHRIGTINVVLDIPARLADAALVNLVATVAEAKAQALRDLDLPATGTPTDAVVILCDPDGPRAEYGGPRSVWGARVARAVHQAIVAGDGTVPWSEKQTVTN
ncbi:adenosylcobinamide amidohydrolase [Rhizomonospora bruguierae]|uniref:adenosylcobinamide amidohydrolase n=1 Tax=Rhizomonospora bruguierae TaxID=1581705 RepID=UPI00278BE761|nr:adenosylcobinamide amidohydrolase [Micromonospora sp. NBRC 107566]